LPPNGDLRLEPGDARQEPGRRLGVNQLRRHVQSRGELRVDRDLVTRPRDLGELKKRRALAVDVDVAVADLQVQVGIADDRPRDAGEKAGFQRGEEGVRELAHGVTPSFQWLSRS
jgi:hypothetical protein